MNFYLLFKSLHLIAVISWMAGLLYLPRIFVYHAEKKQIYIGYVIGLDYQNPHLSPFDEFQRFKTHKDIKKRCKFCG